jgi:CsoR family transcriptional regulator, copper-sensing transcriptional repressor
MTAPRDEMSGPAVADDAVVLAVINRLRRAQGQIGGAISMLEAGRSCSDVVTLLSASSKAVDRAAFQLIATSLRECLIAAPDDSAAVTEQLQKLFLTLA